MCLEAGSDFDFLEFFNGMSQVGAMFVLIVGNKNL